VDLTLHARGEKFLHGVGDTGSWEASLAAAIEKITQQAHKVKGKWQERKRRRTVKGVPIVGEEREAARVVPAGPKPRRERVRMPRILRAQRQPIKAMSVSDAAREMDGDRDGIVIFRDTETSAISVLYRRPNGEMTLVETET
jgi:hypothetical protein